MVDQRLRPATRVPARRHREADLRPGRASLAGRAAARLTLLSPARLTLLAVASLTLLSPARLTLLAVASLTLLAVAAGAEPPRGATEAAGAEPPRGATETAGAEPPRGAGDARGARPRRGVPEADQRYRIQARLDATRHEVEATLELSFANHSGRPLDALELHLYPNAFANKQTVFMREGGARLRDTRLAHPGSIELLALRTQDGRDLLARAQHELVDGDRTQMRIPLAAPLAPGARMTLHGRFRTKLPSLVARSGFVDDFHMVAQWFPKLARLTPDGRWRSFPYHGLGEFSADFADYELTLDVPADHLIAAPGIRLEARTERGRRIERYRAQRVLDVAWASYPAFRRLMDRTRAPTLEVYATPGELHGARRQLAHLRAQVETLSRWLGPYPYARLVLVLPPRGARGAAGMEYPGLMLGWDTPAASLPIEPVMLVRESVTAHELAHQWFAVMVASDEVLHPVLDEGLAELIGNHLERERLSDTSPIARLLGLPIDGFELLRVRAGMLGAPPSSLLPANSYAGARQLAAAVYLRPALTFETIRRTWGARRFDATLGTYARKQRFAHPTPDDLFAAFDDGYWPGFSRRVLEPALQGEVPGMRVAHHGLSETGGAYRLELELTRSPRIALPSTVRIHHADGSVVDHPWPADRPELRLTHRASAAPIAIELDPHGKNLLDSRQRQRIDLTGAAGATALRWRVLGWGQALLRALGP